MLYYSCENHHGHCDPRETGFYYLQSRYYDPSIGRFINADALASTGQSFLGYNMFAYCMNTPINCSDSTGFIPAWANMLRDGAPGGGSCYHTSIDEVLHSATEALSNIADVAAIGAYYLDMYRSAPGVYHASTLCWQILGGYNMLYDVAFDIGTCMETKQFPFTHNGKSYVIWVWKGDYINLGAGAEVGIYVGDGPHYFANPFLSMPMAMSLSCNGSTIIDHRQYTWWMTGFNSNYTNVHAYQLRARFTIDFRYMGGMYDSFKAAHGGSQYWFFPAGGTTAILTF